MITDNIRGSIIKACQGIITQLANDGIGTFEFTDFDTHANMQELPEKDLLGPISLGWGDQGNFLEVTFAIGVSTFNDRNLFRSWKAIGVAYEMLKPTRAIPLYDADTLQVINQMIVMGGTTVAPMSKAELRPFQFVQATVGLEIG